MPPRREVVNFPAEDSISTSSPLYLHPNDNPSTILVTELFNGSNFVDWSRSMKTALLAKNKLGFIDDTVKKPLDPLDPTLAVWERCNGMVVSWLRNATIPKIKSSLMYLESASKIWLDLKERFSQANIARIYELKQQLNNLRQGSHSVNAYYTDLRIIWDEFLDYQPKCWCECTTCRCNSSGKWRDHLERELAVQFLMGLNDSYSAIRSHFLSLDPFPNLSKIFSLVLQEERQKGLGIVGNPFPVSLSETPGSINAAGNFGRGKERPFCTHCKRSNHTVDKCFRLHGYPPGMGRGRGRDNSYSSHMQRSVHNVEAKVHSDGKSQSSSSFHPSPHSMNLFSPDQCTQLISYLQNHIQSQPTSTDSAPPSASASPSDPIPNFSGMFTLTPFVASLTGSAPLWLIETGATHHVCCSQSLFKSMTKVFGAFITLPNSQTIPVESVGTVSLSPSLVLDSVFYVPSFTHNLLSISSLTSANTCKVTFTHNDCVIQDTSTGMLIGMGRRFGKLYVLNDPGSTSAPGSFPSVSNVISSQLWHSRLGHLSHDKLKLLYSTLSIKDVTQTICEICPLAKQKRLSFPLSQSVASSVFDLIHCDIWGPFVPVSVTGSKYFLTIVDDCSRFVWTYLMETKHEVSKILDMFFHQVHTQFNKSIKIIRCDNGSEFLLPNLFSKFGTIVQHSCVERPQQNARVERKHQHLLNVARSLFFQSNIPIEYWGDCVLTASYIINMIPSSLPHLHNSTPFQVLFHKPPQYSHLRSFGCLCFASTLLRDRTKFSPRASKCVFLGYPAGYKGYKLLDIGSNKIFISRDVIFHETVFPFTQSSSHAPDSFPLSLPLSSPSAPLDIATAPSPLTLRNP